MISIETKLSRVNKLIKIKMFLCICPDCRNIGAHYKHIKVCILCPLLPSSQYARQKILNPKLLENGIGFPDNIEILPVNPMFSFSGNCKSNRYIKTQNRIAYLEC